jgi:hypothetical protein
MWNIRPLFQNGPVTPVRGAVRPGAPASAEPKDAPAASTAATPRDRFVPGESAGSGSLAETCLEALHRVENAGDWQQAEREGRAALTRLMLKEPNPFARAALDMADFIGDPRLGAPFLAEVLSRPQALDPGATPRVRLDEMARLGLSVLDQVEEPGAALMAGSVALSAMRQWRPRDPALQFAEESLGEGHLDPAEARVALAEAFRHVQQRD